MAKKITKAVIPAAGFGTRFLPQTKAMPKEMLPIVDKPVIQYVVEEAVESGIQDIVIVTGSQKRAIEDHFDNPSQDLINNLMMGKKDKLLEATQKVADMASYYNEVSHGLMTLNFRFFDTKLREEHHAATPAEAKELMKLLAEKNFSGGGTDISGCSKAALLRIEEIVAQGTTAKPELVVVTDGDDRIAIKSEDVGSNKLHAFVVESSNTALTELATRSGGVGINKL
jgi:hypothetical protein